MENKKNPDEEFSVSKKERDIVWFERFLTSFDAGRIVYLLSKDIAKLSEREDIELTFLNARYHLGRILWFMSQPSPAVIREEEVWNDIRPHLNAIFEMTKQLAEINEREKRN